MHGIWRPFFLLSKLTKSAFKIQCEHWQKLTVEREREREREEERERRRERETERDRDNFF